MYSLERKTEKNPPWYTKKKYLGLEKRSACLPWQEEGLQGAPCEGDVGSTG